MLDRSTTRHRRGLALAGLVFATCVCVYILELGDDHIMRGNEEAHFWQVHAFMNGRLWVQKPPCEWDAAKYEGLCYSNKPPGYPLLLTPVATSIYRGTGRPTLARARADNFRSLRMVYRFMNLLAAAAAAALIVLLVWRQREELGIDESSARFAAVFAGFALGLGTILHPYATSNSSHAFTVLFFVLAIWLILEYRRNPRVWLALLASFVIAYTPLLESKNAFLALPMGLLLVGMASTWRDRLAMAAGVAPCAAVFFGFNWLVFDSALTTGYDHYVDRAYIPWEEDTWSNFANNPLTTLPDALSHPGRGLLFLSPFLVVAPYGFWRWIRQDRVMGATLAAATTAYLLIICSYSIWHGGHSFGHRHLFPIIPVLVVCAAIAASRAGRRWRCVLVAGVLVGLAWNTAGVLIQSGAMDDVWFQPHDLHGTMWHLLDKWWVNVQIHGEGLRHFVPGVATLYLKLAALAGLGAVHAVLIRAHLRAPTEDPEPTGPTGERRTG